jgi:hypothetical protein
MSNIRPDVQDIAMLHRIFGWHVVPWTDAFCEAVSRLESQPRTVLEIGASRLSAPSLFFLRRGAVVDVTCYAETEVPALKAFCDLICGQYDLPMPTIRVHDAFAATEQTYDVIILKGVLGGLDRHHDLEVFSKVIKRLLGNLAENGRLIILDKGWCSPVHNLLLQRFGDAGGNNWHYFSQKELDLLSGHDNPPEVIWKGFTSAGTMPFKGLQRFADWLDSRLFNRFLSRKGTVFAALYRQSRAQRARTTEANNHTERIADIDKQPSR